MTDFFALAEHFKSMTCILSVESYPDGSYGNIRVVSGNREYLNIAHTLDEGDSEMITSAFIPNSPYSRYIPKNPAFEDDCFRCAVKGETIHKYFRPTGFQAWMQMTLNPLSDHEGNTYYFACHYNISPNADVNQMTNLSPDVSSDILSTCVKLRSAKDFHTAVEEVIHDIRDRTDAHHCCIFLTDFAQRKCSVLCEALRKGTNLLPMGDYVNDDFIDIAATWITTLGEDSCVFITTNEAWDNLRKKNPVWYKSMYSAGARSIIMFPLKSNDVILGFIWAINFDVSQSIRIKETLELTTFFIASEIANNQLLHRMEVLSTTDLLTGIYNRNAMNNRIDALLSGEEQKQQIGIVFADLNGLKQVNDEHGHFAGDMLLKNAAITLQLTFKGCEVYRAGGDEFMVLSRTLTEDEIRQRVQELREAAEDPEGVSFAVGWCMGSIGQLHLAMRTADERMYSDKERFYTQHPSLKRS